MKQITKITKSLVLTLFIAIAGTGFSSAQNSAKNDKVVSIETSIKNKNFVFVAQNMQPTSGRFRQLTSYYDLKVANDTIVSYLPYFGRAYAAPFNPTEGGYIFTSTAFDYQVKAGKKDRWEITAVPTDRHYGEKFFMRVFSNGTAMLQVTSNNRQPISFNGYLQDPAKTK